MNGSTTIYILSGIFILVLAVIIFLEWQNKKQGTVIYEDLNDKGIPAKPLYSQKYGLAGKPDMILKKGNDLIPVEVKSAPGRERPYRSHVLQLTSYCLLIEETYGIRPPYGILQYRDRSFEIPFTDEAVEALLYQIDLMREETPEKELPPFCKNQKKCIRCGYREFCQELTE